MGKLEEAIKHLLRRLIPLDEADAISEVELFLLSYRREIEKELKAKLNPKAR